MVPLTGPRSWLEIAMRRRRIGLSVAALVLVLAVGEIVMRLFYGEALGIRLDERNLSYRYDADLGWFPVAGGQGTHRGARRIDVRHNRRGFRDPEHAPDDRPGIMVLGDSFVWGYDVQASERFTDRLRDRIPGWAIYNLGVSGYATDQEFLLLQAQFDFYRPAVVILVFCPINDDDDNARNHSFGYYKPYFRATDDGRLERRGVPVPRSEHYFFARHRGLARSYWFRLVSRLVFDRTAPERVTVPTPTVSILVAMKDFLATRGATLVVGMETAYPELQAILESMQLPVVDLNNEYRYFTHGRHWTADGHRIVADRIHAFLVEREFVDRPSPEDG